MPKRLNPEIPIERLQALYTYDPTLGTIRQEKQGRKAIRPVLPHPVEGFVVLYDSDTRYRKKMKYKDLAYVLATGKPIPEGKTVLCHDLNENNIKLRNLKLVDKAVYRDVQLAIRNLETDMKIVQHPHDKHAFLLTWTEHKASRKSVHYDIASAEAEKREKELMFVKFINRHIMSS